MTALSFTVPGRPEGQRRPRFSRRGLHVHTHSAPEDLVYADRIRWAWREAGAVRLPDEPIRLHLTAYFARPAGHFTTRGVFSAAGRRAPSCPIGRPPASCDIDNLAKAVLDSLNSLAWTDDAQVAELRVRKAWAANGRPEVVVWAGTLDMLEPAA